MEGFLPKSRNQNPPATAPTTSHNKCRTFEDEIERVELRSRNLVSRLLKHKNELKQNLQPYLEKKKIIPSVLQSFGSCHQQFSMKLFNPHYRRIRDHISSQHENVRQAITIDCKENAQPISYKESEQKRMEKWKLEATSQELNCLVYGKELKIGSKYRQKYISDDKIRELKSSSILRCKMKANNNRSQDEPNNHKDEPRKRSNHGPIVKDMAFWKWRQGIRKNKGNKPKYTIISSQEEHLKDLGRNTHNLIYDLQ